MNTARAGLAGAPPTVAEGQGNPEAQKYGKLWETKEYRAVAPGEGLAQVFLQHARPRRGAEVLDFGCGTGRGALMLAILGGVKVTMIDFVRNCLDPEIQEALTTQAHALSFIKADLEQPIPVVAEYGFCTDVMEHIPTDKVDRVLDNILKAARHVFFSIATTDDKCGALIGEPLHLTVQSYGWWLQKLSAHDAVIHWSKREEGSCLFYVSAWATGLDIVKTGVLNVEEELIRTNVRHNIAQGWEQVHPFPTNDIEFMILGGGPSLNAFEAEIKQKRAEGVKLATLNGAYNWALEHGLTPSAQIMVDARAFNARFTKPVVDHCKYFIASQCDPSVLDGLPKDRTYLFHTMTALVEDLLTAQYGPVWHSIPGGSTVLLRAIPLLRMLGFAKFHLYGCDSCLLPRWRLRRPDGDFQRYGHGLSHDDGKTALEYPSEKEALEARLELEMDWGVAGLVLEETNLVHHAYAQPENNGVPAYPVTVGGSGGRVFSCHGWQISQAQEFLDLVKVLGDDIELAIYGDGLLAYLLETGAQMSYDEDARASAMQFI